VANKSSHKRIFLDSEPAAVKGVMIRYALFRTSFCSAGEARKAPLHFCHESSQDFK